MSIGATTELEAVNVMLSTIGESPINSLGAISGVVDAVTARSILKEISVETQAEGWHFNLETNFKLQPDMLSQEILIPGNCIQADASGPDEQRDVCVRGGKLYDREAHSFQFTKPVTVDMTLLLEFEELPQAVRYYILIRAARVFQQRVVGSEVLGSFTSQDEQRARAVLKKFEADTADYNILTGNYSVMRTIDR